MRLNLKLVASYVGLLLALNGIFMFLCLPYSIHFENGDFKALLISGSINTIVGLASYFIFSPQASKEVRRRDGYVIVTTGWIMISLFGTLPYLISGSIPSFTNAFFESMSGYTTTGATILSDIEAMPNGILLWRSITQWIGGMGIIVLTVAILPLLGIGGMQLYVSEAPGISPDKLTPRINETAKRLWTIYVGFTFLLVFILKFGGLNMFDSINHALTTMATGGFSTKQASIAHFSSPFIQYTIILFMIISGTNYTLLYHGLKGRFSRVLRNEEFRMFFTIVFVATSLCGVGIFVSSSIGAEESFREALFQIVSILTSTGYATADYTAWPIHLTFIIIILMFIGGAAGSTSGGVKIIRHLVLLKNSFLELRRLLHPSAILSVRLNGKAISEKITFNVLAFVILYIFIFGVSSVVLSFYRNGFYDLHRCLPWLL